VVTCTVPVTIFQYLVTSIYFYFKTKHFKLSIGLYIMAHVCCPAWFSKLNPNWCTGCIL